jgi:hypothetical protein
MRNVEPSHAPELWLRTFGQIRTPIARALPSRRSQGKTRRAQLS